MGVIKVIITILLVIATLGGVLIFSYKFAQDNPFDTSHKHELALVEAKDATCNKTGNKPHYVCKGCDGIFADESGLVALTAEDITIAALGHNYENAPCKGIIKCAGCGLTQGTSDYHTPATPVVENTVIGTCVKEGSYERVVNCKVCGHEISRETVSTTLSGHVNSDGDDKCDVCGKKDLTPHIRGEAKEENRKEATVDTDGSYSIVYYCTECNSRLSDTKVIIPAGTPAKGSDLGASVFSTGSIIAICSFAAIAIVAATAMYFIRKKKRGILNDEDNV